MCQVPRYLNSGDINQFPVPNSPALLSSLVVHVTQLQDAIHTGTQSFTYDALNRLTAASGAYGLGTYAYTPLGNLTSKDGLGLSYPLAGSPLSVTAVDRLPSGR